VNRALRLVAWPYHGGLSDVGMGLGATVLAADEGFRAALAEAGWDVTVERVPPVDDTRPEVARIFELDRRLAHRVAGARAAGAFPLVLAGNCISCLGTTAGAGGGRLGAVWFDAHADFDTPDDNLSGFTDVMGLSVLTGTGWRALRETIPGFEPLPERNVVLAGVRDLEPYQRARLESSELRTVPGAIDHGALHAHLDELRGAVDDVYLHVDLDALDASVGPVNPYAAAGGPSLEALIAAIEAVFDRFTVAAAALTAYDPRLDGEGTVLAAARSVAAAIARRAAPQRQVTGRSRSGH
jgi:arginase